MKIVPFEIHHIIALKLALTRSSFNVDPLQYADAVDVKGLAFTALENDTPVAAGGVIPLWKGTGEAWTLIHPSACLSGFFLHRHVKNKLAEIWKSETFQRIQMNVELGFSKGCRWAEVLGFKNEGILNHYTPDGKSYVRYAIWKQP